jgi:hypothetical protein
MSTSNKCKNKNCGCQKGLTTQCSNLPICPNPQPCDYVTKADCVIYTGDTLMCDSQVALETGANLSVALQDIYTKLCNLNICNLSAVIFVSNNNLENYELSVAVAGGSGTYTYSWSFIDSYGNVGFTTVTNTPTVGLNTELAFSRLVQVTVTDSETGCKTKQTFMVVFIGPDEPTGPNQDSPLTPA